MSITQDRKEFVNSNDESLQINPSEYGMSDELYERMSARKDSEGQRFSLFGLRSVYRTQLSKVKEENHVGDTVDLSNTSEIKARYS